MPEFQRAIGEFNDGRYFECHDTLEALWVDASGDERRFLQGMIQISVGFYHFFNGNPSGALSQWGKGSDKLALFAPFHGGIDLETLLAAVRVWSDLAVRRLSGDESPDRMPRAPRLAISHNR